MSGADTATVIVKRRLLDEQNSSHKMRRRTCDGDLCQAGDLRERHALLDEVC